MNLSDGSRVLLCCLWCFLAIVKDTYGQMKPSNAVAEVGGEAIFNCSGLSFLPNWFMSKDGTITNQMPIAGSCNVNINLQNHYKTEQIGGANNCNLIIFDVTMEQAGVYWCTEIGSSYALLTVIDKSPATTQNFTQGVVVENENVIMTCTLHHNGSVAPAPTLEPYFYWTNSNGQNTSSSYDSTTENTAVSQITVVAGRQDITGYTCHVYLKLNATTVPNYANNTPTVSNSVTTTPISVLYGPAAINISNVLTNMTKCDVVCRVSQLTCYAAANPSSFYYWTDVTNKVDTRVVGESEKFLLAEETRDYECTAYNYIRGEIHSVSFTYTVDDNIDNVIPCEFPYNSKMNIEIEGAVCESSTCHCTGDTQVLLNCSVEAFPEPSYQWQLDYKPVAEGPVYEAVYDGVYTCISTNYLFATKSITLAGCLTDSSTNAGCTVAVSESANMSSDKIAAIVLGVLFGLAFTGDVVLFLFCAYILRRTPAKADSESSNKIVEAREMPMPCENVAAATYEELVPVTNSEQSPAYEQLSPASTVCEDESPK